MKPPDADDLWPRPQWCSIVCPQCGRPAARLVYQAPLARYLHYSKAGAYWHTVVLADFQETESDGSEEEKEARRH